MIMTLPDFTLANGLDYIDVYIVGLEQRITNGIRPTKYIVYLTGPNAGMSFPVTDDQ